MHKAAQVPTATGKQQQANIKPALNAYNIFFQLERKRILSGQSSKDQEQKYNVCREELREVIAEYKSRGKRQHRKSHGIIGFQELARLVAKRWKALDPNTKQVFEEQAALEKQEYNKAMKAWKDAQQQQEKEQQEKNLLKPHTCQSANSPTSAPMNLLESLGLLSNSAGTITNVNTAGADMTALLQIRAQIENEMSRLVSSSSEVQSFSPQEPPVRQDDPLDIHEDFDFSGLVSLDSEEQQQETTANKDFIPFTYSSGMTHSNSLCDMIMLMNHSEPQAEEPFQLNYHSTMDQTAQSAQQLMNVFSQPASRY
eukprot:CAMPEP_0172439252 /NCGR_PEP_ID=MMETSP1065-20121228/300_1 /TAXON_ID=265537 /ORGANISM="Amphiprora paludosa, Strain CCMP125" /LENGTH=311 /DNA_ID=CAMNT_0013187905 /DNA_START=344 /DNA_END=1279 /DNA_ORIENTATION=-